MIRLCIEVESDLKESENNANNLASGILANTNLHISNVRRQALDQNLSISGRVSCWQSIDTSELMKAPTTLT